MPTTWWIFSTRPRTARMRAYISARTGSPEDSDATPRRGYGMARCCHGIARAYGCQISFSPFRLAWPSLPTMMWSCTEMPSGLAISTIDCVIWMSARDGVGSPDGWLCTRMIAVARQLQRALDHLARIDRRVVDRAGLLHLVGDHLVALVEEDARGTAPCRRTPWWCGNSRAPPTMTTAPVRFLTCAAREPARRRLHDLDLGDRGLAQPFDLARAAAGGADTTSANEPNFAISALASGLTSRRGMARNSTSSSSSYSVTASGPASRKRSRSRSRWPR